MSIPGFPDAMFPNTVIVRLSDDVIGREGGAKPHPASPGITIDRVSVQERGSMWDVMRRATVTMYRVSFQVDPTSSLSRAIRGGDQIEWAGLKLSTVGPLKDRGGYGFLWRIECEHVKT